MSVVPRSAAAAFALQLCFLAHAAEPHCAVNGQPFERPYVDGQFRGTDAPVDSDELVRWTAARFTPQTTLEAISSAGEPLSVLVERIERPDRLGETYLRVKPSRELKPGEDVFYCTHGLRAAVVPQVRSTLDAELMKAWSVRIQKVFRAQPRDGQLRRVEIRSPLIFSAQGLGDVVVAAFRVHLHIVYTDENPPRRRIDDRGTALVVYSRKPNRVLNLQVGHPEWTSEDRVLVDTGPIMFFSAAEKTYLLTRWSCAWECTDYAIIDMTTGRPVNWTVQNAAKEWSR